jgi:hypothetical protein
MPRLSLLTLPLLAAMLCAFAAPARAAVLIEIDKTTQTMDVSVDGAPRWSWPVSTGRGRYDTPSGSFRPFRMEADHYSKEWDEAPMPHSIFFTMEGHAIHGSFETKNLGRPASHGCVRLAPENAAQLFALVTEQGVGNARVVVSGEASSAPAVAKRSTPREERETRPGYGAYASGYPSAYAPPRSYAPPPAYYYYQQRLTIIYRY